jgi:hypothetical protein
MVSSRPMTHYQLAYYLCIYYVFPSLLPNPFES